MGSVRDAMFKRLGERPAIWVFDLAESGEPEMTIGVLKPKADQVKEFYRKSSELALDINPDEKDKQKLTEENLKALENNDTLATWVALTFSATKEQNENGDYEKLFETTDDVRATFTYSDRIKLSAFWIKKAISSMGEEGTGKN